MLGPQLIGDPKERSEALVLQRCCVSRYLLTPVRGGSLVGATLFNEDSSGLWSKCNATAATAPKTSSQLRRSDLIDSVSGRSRSILGLPPWMLIGTVHFLLRNSVEKRVSLGRRLPPGESLWLWEAYQHISLLPVTNVTAHSRKSSMLWTDVQLHSTNEEDGSFHQRQVWLCRPTPFHIMVLIRLIQSPNGHFQAMPAFHEPYRLGSATLGAQNGNRWSPWSLGFLALSSSRSRRVSRLAYDRYSKMPRHAELSWGQEARERESIAARHSARHAKKTSLVRALGDLYL